MAQPVPARAAPPPRAWGNLQAGMLLFVVTVFAYLPSFRGEFIWNDSDYVTAPELRSLSGLSAIWTKIGATEQYYPLLHTFFWVQHRLWGDHPFGYHLVTLLLHITGSILFALILQRLAVPGAWLAGFIFALHPVHVESVAWITEQKNTLSLVFYLLAGWYYLQFDETRRPRTYVLALAWFVLSLLCKTVTASLPAALLVTFWWKRGRLDWRRDVQPLIPWLVIGAAVGLFTSWVEKNYLGAQGQDFNLPLLERGLVAGRAIWFYLANLLWPFDLNFIYPRWVPSAGVWWQWLFPLGVLVLLFFCWSVRARSRAPLAAALLFIGSLFPVLGFVNLYGALYSFVWDHWQYLPDLAPIALLSAGLVLGWDRLASRLPGLGPVLASLLVLLLAALSWSHCAMFRSEEALYRETLARNPDVWMAHYNLGGIYSRRADGQAQAMAEYEATLRLKPDHAGAHTNLANLLVNQPGRLPDAIAHYEAALRIDPNAEFEYDLASALARSPDRLAEAAAHFEAAIKLRPKVAKVRYNFANVLMKMPGRQPEALEQYQAALQLDPNLAEAHYNFGLALLSDPAHVPEGIGHLETALRLGPDFPLARQIVARWRSLQSH
ncbi:MAG TPA: tetratricopeptide repeat protein [Opitutaceae bacterium]|nr:tetratricopeptide repeat protein [Opitutaceae bacterium]